MELLTRMLERGGAIGWVPTARVRHIVPATRARRSWLLRRAWAQGRSDTIAARLAGRANSVTSELQSGSGALVRGWRATRREVRDAPERPAALLDDVMRRTRCLGRAAQTLSDGHDQRRR